MNNNKTINNNNLFILDNNSHLNDPWFVYEIGNLFHNSNGEDYVILAMDKDKDKMILAKKSKKNGETAVSFIGAKGIGLHSWSFGHYFLQNFEAACNWFNESDEEEKDGISYKDFMDLFIGPDDEIFFVCDVGTFAYYQFAVEDMPSEIKKCNIRHIGTKEFYMSSSEDIMDDDYVTGITLYIDFEKNGINVKEFTQDYRSHEL